MRLLAAEMTKKGASDWWMAMKKKPEAGSDPVVTKDMAKDLSVEFHGVRKRSFV